MPVQSSACVVAMCLSVNLFCSSMESPPNSLPSLHCTGLRTSFFAIFWVFIREQMKTVSVALVMCLNVGVDPPDVMKTSPCARQECWIGTIQAFLPSLEIAHSRKFPHRCYDLYQGNLILSRTGIIFGEA